MSTPTGSDSADQQVPPRGAQAIERALGVMLSFATEAPALSLSEVASRNGLNVSTAHRILRALQGSGFLVQRPSDSRYVLGPAVVRLSRVVLARSRRDALAVLAVPHLEQLRDETGETAGLHVPADNGRVCVAEAESRSRMRMASGVGTELPWHAGAASKALLSAMTDKQRDAALFHTNWRRVTSGTQRDMKSVLAQVAEARERGYAISIGETVEGAGAIAVPVRGVDNEVVAAINVTGPALRWTRERMVAAAPQLQRCAQMIERDLGGDSVAVDTNEGGATG